MASIVAIGIFAFFVAGALFGFIAMVALAVRREDKGQSLPRQAPDRMALGTRRVTGVCWRTVDDELEALSRELVH